MRAIHLTLSLFCNALLAAVVFHFTSSLVAASPLFEHHKPADVPVAPPPPSPPCGADELNNRQYHPTPKESLDQNKSMLPIVARTNGCVPNLMAPLGSALVGEPKPKVLEPELSARSAVAPAVNQVVEQQQQQQQPIAVASAAVEPQKVALPPVLAQSTSISHRQAEHGIASIPHQPVLTERKATELGELSSIGGVDRPPVLEVNRQHVDKQAEILAKKDVPIEASGQLIAGPKLEAPVVAQSVALAPTSPLANQQTELVHPQLAVKEAEEKPAPVVPQPEALVADPVEPAVIVPLLAIVPPVPVEAPIVAPAPVEKLVIAGAASPSQVQSVVVKQPVVEPETKSQLATTGSAHADTKAATKVPAVVMGGLGPLHMLASTLCSYQVDKLVADEHLNQLYARRASVRRSLFEFMSLKFTNLEKLSSRLGYGLQVVPIKSPEDNKAPGQLPSHGWPVVGKCTAHDLKLMGEAAWCECNPESDQGCQGTRKPEVQEKAQVNEPHGAITSNQHNRVVSARSLESPISRPSSYAFLPSPDGESPVISKILHVGDIKDAPTVESSIYNLNLTQHQLATLEAQATSTLECRRNSLRYTKALFNHLAEDQKSVSESWPKLYALISADDCARKRMIDIVNALSSFRTDTTSIRRDNLEFAFAMDDLRSKVLESEVNVPLTFDRHFIEVEQFLQQSVRLMLANIQPKRAKLTSMRYRSLMYGASQSADDQCIDLHQRLLSRNYPLDCNPTQFGQLPDVLRMTASSLELYSIEKELSQQTSKIIQEGQQKVKDDVNECIANLVSS